jgi:CRP/FNR family cyclic AMP-dependent transcriptional regulator
MATQAVTPLLHATTFGSFEPATLARLGALGRVIDVPAGSVPIREGTVCDWLGVVVTGRFGLRLRLPGGLDRTILSVEPGDVVGWSAALSPSVATSTAIAVLPTTAVVFDGVSLRSTLATDCELAAAVYERLLSAVARRLVATRLQLLDLYRPGAEPW